MNKSEDHEKINYKGVKINKLYGMGLPPNEFCFVCAKSYFMMLIVSLYEVNCRLCM